MDYSIRKDHITRFCIHMKWIILHYICMDYKMSFIYYNCSNAVEKKPGKAFKICIDEFI